MSTPWQIEFNTWKSPMDHMSRTAKYRQVCFATSQKLAKFGNTQNLFKIHRGLSPEIQRKTYVLNTSLYNLRRNDTEKR